MGTVLPIRDPKSLSLPDEFETARLLIRCPKPGDGAAVNAAVADSMGSLKPWMDWAGEVPLLEDTERRQCENCLQYRQRKALHFNTYLIETGEFVNKPALFAIDWTIPCCEIGYWQSSRFDGQGFMTEAVLGVTEFAFARLGMARVELRCDALNQRSIRVAERAGFQCEGHLRNARRNRGGDLRDTLIYARIISSEYAEHPEYTGTDA